MKDPGQQWCGYSNLGKILIKSVAAKRVAATFVAAREDLPENPASRHPPSRAKRGLCKAVPLSATLDAFITVQSP